MKREHEKIRKDLSDSTTAAFREIERLQKILDEETGKVGELAIYPIAKVLQGGIKAAGTATYHTFGITQKPSIALAMAKEAYEKSLLLVEPNREILARNEKIVGKLLAMIENAGIPDRVSVAAPKRNNRYNRDTVAAGWRSLGSQVHLRDAWPTFEAGYAEFVKNCETWQREIDVEVERQKKAVETEQAQKKAAVEAETTRVELCLKYSLPTLGTTMREIREAVIESNKYLRLAHYMLRNRSDWSDGPDFAKTGVRGFAVEDAQDQKIVDNITSHIDDWDGDGRIFRDCEWNYDRLFAMVPEPLMADYKRTDSRDDDE